MHYLIVFAILCLIQLTIEWLLVDVVAFVLASSNLVGYTKCSKDAKLNMQQSAVSRRPGCCSCPHRRLGKAVWRRLLWPSVGGCGVYDDNNISR